jgi:CubicO group peptidase (beta-lactamase class C family)
MVRAGTCFAYAHVNFVILGKVPEKATGRGVAERLRRNSYLVR